MPEDDLQALGDADAAIWRNVFNAAQPENQPAKPDKPVKAISGKWVYQDTGSGSNIGTGWRFKD